MFRFVKKEYLKFRIKHYRRSLCNSDPNTREYAINGLNKLGRNDLIRESKMEWDKAMGLIQEQINSHPELIKDEHISRAVDYLRKYGGFTAKYYPPSIETRVVKGDEVYNSSGMSTYEEITEEYEIPEKISISPKEG